MIVKMKKITLLVEERYRDQALNKLRNLGIFHVHYVKAPAAQDITSIETDIANIDKALLYIGEESASVSKKDTKQTPSIIEKILNLVHEKELLLSDLEEYKEQHRWFDTWGAVSYESLQTLKEAGLYVRFYIANKSTLKDILVDKPTHIVKEDGGTIYFAYFAESEDEFLDFKQEFMPNIELSTLDEKINSAEQKITHINKQLKDFSKESPSLLAYKQHLHKILEFNKVKHSMGEIENIAYLQGFCPVNTLSTLKTEADQDGWGYAIEDPDASDDVPTLLKQPRWLRLVNPVFKFMGTLPGYDEVDISFWFLLFFSLFFGILIGDAGYGLLFLLTGFYFSRKMPNAPREPFRLLNILSITTIIWGVISGNWFGVQKIGQLPFLNTLIIDKVDAFVDTNQLFMMYFCFVIGAIHLTIAHAVAGLKKINSLTALAELGWICVVWTLFFAAGYLVLKKPFPGFMSNVFIVGVALILIFANFQKNILKGMALTLSNLPLSIISSFSDVVSYLRLFAVGYATVTVASSFNGMAASLGFSSILAGFISAIILLFGHTLNILLALMAVIVHGIRLNMLEFSSHVNMQWSGKPYSPFKE